MNEFEGITIRKGFLSHDMYGLKLYDTYFQFPISPVYKLITFCKTI